jgi:hypothetical protein
MLTYDQPHQVDELHTLAQSGIPDEVEAAETDLYWISVRRSNRTVILKSKHSGMVEASVLYDAVMVLASLSANQLACIKAAFTIKTPVR